jgi:hypothetical protein
MIYLEKKDKEMLVLKGREFVVLMFAGRKERITPNVWNKYKNNNGENIRRWFEALMFVDSYKYNVERGILGNSNCILSDSFEHSR